MVWFMAESLTAAGTTTGGHLKWDGPGVNTICTSVHPMIHSTVKPNIRPYVCVCLCVCVCLSVCLYVCVCRSPYVWMD